MSNVSVFVVAIVKGLVEHNEADRHFGSTLAFKDHFADAVRLHLVYEFKEVTEQGLHFYNTNNLKSLPDGRATFWEKREWTL